MTKMKIEDLFVFHSLALNVYLSPSKSYSHFNLVYMLIQKYTVCKYYSTTAIGAPD